MHSSEQAKQHAIELRSRIYTALRDGDLDVEPVLELAYLLEEWGVSTPATREILERPLARLTERDLARLGRRLLKDAGFEPTFALVPDLWVALERALRAVERDARATGTTGALRLVMPDWDDSGQAWVEFRGVCQGNGIRPVEGGDPDGGLATVADAAQEVITEVTWAAWPVCPVHDLGLHATLEHKTAVWRCKSATTHTVARVGQLSP
ncbi:hypothetical protein ACFLIM_40675 [Nonomuraea sp. M3C6]|uniref:Uncharacterized protein n=1 Tax=Nonomuraea marmarensis TaxID=3351344 RepID=A0ABW7AQ48_9ACTN